MKIMESSAPLIASSSAVSASLLKGPFYEEQEAHSAIIQAGRCTVENRLVDSFFGNISYLTGDTLHISQTSSSLDELEGDVDDCFEDRLITKEEYNLLKDLFGQTKYQIDHYLDSLSKLSREGKWKTRFKK